MLIFFVHPQRLKSALWLEIGRIVDDETIKLGVDATPQFIGALMEMVWAQIGTFHPVLMRDYFTLFMPAMAIPRERCVRDADITFRNRRTGPGGIRQVRANLHLSPLLQLEKSSASPPRYFSSLLTL